MKKIKSIFKNNKWIFLSFLLSSFIVITIYTLQKIAPFGGNSMLDVDFYHQYGPLLNELYDRVVEGKSLLYSFNTGGGIPFYRNFLNYLSSPFNIFLFLFKKENIVMAFSIVIALKMILSSCTMSIYLKKTFNKDNIFVSIFGALYAFSGYFCAYYWNIMWLDGMVFLPLIMLGINNILNKNDIKLYVISLAMMLLANYFIGYMICLFSVLYFIGLFIYKGNFKFKNIIKKGLLFFIASLLAGGIVSFLLIPLFYALSSISATGGSFPDSSFSFSVTDFIFNHFTGVKRTVFASDILPLPNIYPGMFSLVLIILIYFNKKINLKAKIMVLLAIILFFFMFNVTTFDFIWHAFHVPNDLPWRYSFIYTFILIVFAFYSVNHIKDVDILKISISFGILIILVLISNYLGFENIDDKTSIFCLMILIMYYIITIFIINDFNKMIVYSTILVVVLLECVYAINSNWSIDHNIENFMEDKPVYQKLINNLVKDDNDLYRIEKTDNLTLNDGAWFNFRGISTFSSMAYESVSKTQRMLGLGGNDINSYYYKNYQTPVYNSMFNIKYIIGDGIENTYYKAINPDSSILVNEYLYPTSIAYAVDSDIKNWDLISYRPFLNQSNFVSLTTKVEDIYEPVKLINLNGAKLLSNTLENEFTYEIEDDNNNFEIILDNSKKDNIYLYVGGDDISSFYVEDEYHYITSDEYYILDIGKYESDSITVKVNKEEGSINTGDIKIYAYTLNKEHFNEFYNIISNNLLKVSRYSDTFIEGSLDAKENKTVFTTIAYDSGWNIHVDGKKAKTYSVADSFMAFDITSGKHTIKMIYRPSKMLLGIIISIASILCFIMANLILAKEKNKKGKFIV